MSNEAIMNEPVATTEQSIARQWYMPIEVDVLKTWLLCAAFMNLVVFGGEYLRQDGLAMQLSALSIIALIVARILLPDGEADWKRWIVLLAAICGFGCGVYSLASSGMAIYDFWSRGWMMIPAALTAYWMLSGPVTEWSTGKVQSAEKGLARNKSLVPRFEDIGSHTLLIHAIALVIIPVIWILDVAVSPGNALGGKIGDAFTMEHFAQILGSDAFWVWTKNSLIVAIGTTMLGLCLAVPAGYSFSRYDFSGKKESMFAFMLIQMFPGIIILVPYFMVMKTLGLLNTSIGLIIAYSVTALPLCVWMLKGFFDTVPRELEEAAMLDGCSQLQIFFRIVLPLSLPAVAITGLFSFLAAWNEYLLALIFNTSNDQFTLPVGLASLIPSTGQRWGDFSAASIIVSTPVVILFMLFQKSLVQGLSAGAVKG